MNFCTKCGASITSHKHHVCKKTVSEIVEEMPCPTCGQDLNLPADINAQELAALRSRLAEAEGVAKAMAGLIGGMEDDDPWIFSKNGGQEIMQAYEAYKSKHGQVVGT